MYFGSRQKRHRPVCPQTSATLSELQVPDLVHREGPTLTIFDGGRLLARAQVMPVGGI